MAPEDRILKQIRTLVLLAPIAIVVGFLAYTELSWRGQPQPIAFPHNLHAGTREIDCKYCHRGVEKGNHAGVPSVTDCWQCHQGLIKDGSKGGPVINQPEVRKLLNDYVVQNRDIRWFKNYDLPEHVKFSHRAHVTNAGFDCAKCHGDVKAMEEIKLQQKPTMGWCISCHRENNGPTDCTTCHY